MKARFLFLLIAFFSFLTASAQAFRETRAVWLTTIFGLDWPHTKGAEAQKRELCTMLDSLAKAGINTVLFQTRIRGTVIYPSRIEPWDAVFGGRNPGYDPLQLAIDECHKRGMQLHAWVVTMLVAGKKAVDPGQPATAKRIADVCREIAERYDVDGIHLDYIRYPDREYRLNDNPTYRRYGRGRDKSQWRRDNVTEIVRQVHRAVKAVKPWLCLSSSPVGKRADLSRYSSRGWNAQVAVHQDVAVWMREGLMDVIFPMMYFRGDQFYPFALDWREQSADGHCTVVPGLGVYQLVTAGWPLVEVQRQLCFLRRHGLGQCFFRAQFVLDDSQGFYSWLCWHNSEPALPVPMHTTSPLPQPPVVEAGTQAGVLRWQSQQGLRYNVYAVRPDGTSALVAPALEGGEWTFNPYAALSHRVRFEVRAMDRWGRESQ